MTGSPTPALSFSGLRDELDEVARKHASLSGMESVWVDRGDALGRMAGLAKARLALQPEVGKLLEKFQELSHRKAVGVYEDLLSVLLNEILPGDRLARLTLSTERSLPALEIEIEKGGHSESVMDGTGGAVTNVMSVGLRAIALARSGHFPFLALDEADCWIKPTRVHRFASVLSSVSGQLGMQMLMVSHHDASFFSGNASVLCLVRRGGKIECDRMSSLPVAADGVAAAPERRRIESIRLIDFMSHENTLLPIGAGVTCVTGENDIGKSAILSALRSVFYGECSDAFIRHGCSKFSVTVGFTDGGELTLEHHLKRSPKRTWKFGVCGAAPDKESSPKLGPPDWLAEVCKVDRVEGLDVQLSNQKMPVFLLDQPASKRAAILSVGRETEHLQKMSALNKQKTSADSLMVRESEKEAETIRRRLALLSGLPEMAAKIAALRSGLSDLASAGDRVECSRNKLEILETLAGRSLLDAKAMDVPSPPALRSTIRAEEKVRAVETRVSVLDRIGAFPGGGGCPLPVLSATSGHYSRVSRLGLLASSAGSEVPSRSPPQPCLSSVSNGLSKGSRLWRLGRVLSSCRDGDLDGFALAAFPVMPPTKRGQLLLDRFSKVASVFETDLGGMTSSLSSPPMIDPLGPWIKALSESLLASRRERELVESSKSTEEAARGCRSSLEEAVEDLGGVCPTCFGELSAARVWKGCRHDR